jgi:hypothetical protein
MQRDVHIYLLPSKLPYLCIFFLLLFSFRDGIGKKKRAEKTVYPEYKCIVPFSFLFACF